MRRTDDIHWPADLQPHEADIHTFNARLIQGPSAAVWGLPAHAQAWPTWYPHARRVVIDGGALKLGLGTRFSWTTLGVRIHTVMDIFEPTRRRSQGLSAKGYYAWVLAPVLDGTRAPPEEVQRGMTPRLLWPVLEPAWAHDVWPEWLERQLKRQGHGVPGHRQLQAWW